MPRKLPEAVKEFVRANAHLLSDAQIAATLSRILGTPFTRHAVHHIRESLGVFKLRGLGPPRLRDARLPPPPSGTISEN